MANESKLKNRKKSDKDLHGTKAEISRINRSIEGLELKLSKLEHEMHFNTVKKRI